MDELFTLPEARSFLNAIAAWTTLVIFDQRGSGASARAVNDISPEADAQDINAVADAADVRAFTLFAMSVTTACARYAVNHPERVLQLVLWAPGGEDSETDASSFCEDWSYGRRL